MAVLAGKHVVITGASAGIGAELARQLAAHSCRITLAARREDKLAEVAELVQAAGGQAHVVPCDVTERQQVMALAGSARDRFGEIDTWVNNAGAGIRHRVLDITEEDMIYVFKLNCLSSLWGYQAVIPPWLAQQRNGQVIDINSVAGKSGLAFSGGYCAAKHAMSALGDTLRQELAASGIHITTIYPGPTVSDFSSAAIDRSNGTVPASLGRFKRHANPIVRAVARPQPTAYIVQVIIRAMIRPVPTVYPHRWAILAALMSNFWPKLMLRILRAANGRSNR